MEALILILLLLMPGVWSANLGVTLESQCALRGTTIVIQCKYEYDVGHLVTAVNWFKAQYESQQLRLFPLSALSPAPGHFRYVGNFRSDCSLQISDVQHTDEGQYYFRFATTRSIWISRTAAYLSVKELTANVQPRTVTEGGNVSLTCVSGCPSPVDTVWFKDGQPVLNLVFKARREDVGRYYCAIVGQKTSTSAPVMLDVQYHPFNVSISINPTAQPDPTRVFGGSTVNLTCSADANPAVDSYTWYMRTAPTSPMQWVGSGQLLYIPSMEASDSGLYICQASNLLGDNFSAELLLSMMEDGPGGQLLLPVVAGIGVFLFVTFVLVLLFWRNQQKNAENKQTESDLGLGVKHTSDNENESNSDYVDIHPIPCSPPPVTDITLHSQRSSYCEPDASTSDEGEVTYAIVTMKPRNTSRPHHKDNSGSTPQDSQSNVRENDDSVIYAIMAKPS